MIAKFLLLATLAITIFCSQPAFAADNLTLAIASALKTSCVNSDKTAVRVIKASSGEVLFDRKGLMPLLPASVMKLVTTASALHYLGPAFRFRTEFLSAGERGGGVIDGDLIIRGGGDPKLTPEAVWLMVEELRRMGLTEIEGDIVVDDSFFDGHKSPPSWKAKRSSRAYDAGIGALSVNFNTIAFHIYPAQKPGAPLIVGVEPAAGEVRLINKSLTSNKKRGKVTVRKMNSKNKKVFIIKGAMKPGAKKKIIYLNVDEPWRYAGEIFLAYLNRAGIKTKGKIIRGVAPANAKLLYSHKSQPLAVTLRELNRYSSNFMAEQIVKTIAANISGKPGAHRSALGLTKKFLLESGVNVEGVKLMDGSGMSRQNRLTARAITDLLEKMAGRFDIGPDFISSLGIMGVDGSVGKRLIASPAKAFARAKTGTLNGVSSLAGYVEGKSGELFAYAILMNKNRCYYKKADTIEDDIVTAIRLFGEDPR